MLIESGIIPLSTFVSIAISIADGSSDEQVQAMSEGSPTRRRRTPEQARADILEVAERRLGEHGLDGLNVVDVARDAGMSHATLIHHFGNADRMRRALINHMTSRMLRDVIAALQGDSPQPVVILKDLFAALSQSGHAKLLAWLAVGDSALRKSLDDPPPEVTDLFAELIPVLARRLPKSFDQESAARRMAYLVATAAIGHGVSGPLLTRVVGLAPEEAEAFPEWLGLELQRVLDQAPG
jgi:AcrR family transcriptional regulator